MHLAPETVSLKNGKTAVFRAAEPDDAPEMIAFLKDTAGETPFLLRYPDEVNFTEEGERSLLQSRSDDPSVVMLSAWVGGRLAGNCTLTPKGARRKICHRAGVAIAIRKAYWGLGLGKALLTRVLTLAKRARLRTGGAGGHQRQRPGAGSVSARWLCADGPYAQRLPL